MRKCAPRTARTKSHPPGGKSSYSLPLLCLLFAALSHKQPPAHTRKENTMTNRFTLGIEEEFQLVDKKTGQLVPRVHTILDKGEPILGEHIKAEMLQSAVEIIT